jgi:hypothetical protein
MTRSEKGQKWEPDGPGVNPDFNKHIPTPRHYHPEPPHFHPDCGECREAARRLTRTGVRHGTGAKGKGEGDMRLACLALLGVALLRGQTSTQADLQQWLAVWQQKQQLQAWSIEITEARLKDLGGNVGDTHFLGSNRARIRVLDAAEVPNIPARMLRKYSELTVVHELVHVSLAPLQGSNAQTPAVDNIVEDIAEALLFGKVPACATPRDFMEAEIVSLAWKPDAGIREQVIRKLTAAFLDGRPNWTAQHTAACAATIKTFFARSGWR